MVYFPHSCGGEPNNHTDEFDEIELSPRMWGRTDCMARYRESTMSFNLFSRRFVNAKLLNGEEQIFDLLGLLRKSAEIRCIAMASPLDDFAIHRLLLCLIHEASPGEVIADGLSDDLLKTILQREKLFDLFDKNRPFFQDPTAIENERRPVSDLFAEMPSDTGINHTWHIYDFERPPLSGLLCYRAATIAGVLHSRRPRQGAIFERGPAHLCSAARRNVT